MKKQFEQIVLNNFECMENVPTCSKPLEGWLKNLLNAKFSV